MSASAITAYRTDLSQLVRFLAVAETNFTIAAAADITRADVAEYLSSLGGHWLSATMRAMRPATIREFFRVIEEQGLVAKNPTLG